MREDLDQDDALLDAVGGLGDGRHGDLDRIAQQLAGERANVGRHGRREKQVLPLSRQLAHDAADRPDKAEIEHAVDFVEHQELDRAQVCDMRIEMIDQPAGRRDQHVEAGRERAHLGAVGNAAEHDRDLERQPVGKVAEALRDLARQFPRRAQHQRAHAAPGRGAPVGREAVEDRQREGRRLSGAGLGDADQVAAFEKRRNRLRLNWGRTREAELGQREIKGRGEAEPMKIIQGEFFQNAA